MIKMQNLILRHQNKSLSLKLAFSKLKISTFQPQPQSDSQSANITNKALYLDYVEQVLKSKESDLISLEKIIAKKEEDLKNVQFSKGIGQLIHQMESIKLMEKKLKSVQQKMGVREEEYLSLYRRFEADCNRSKNQIEEAFKKQYIDIANQRKILRSKLSQFAELESYEKYLNQLHNALEIKSQELAQRQSILDQSQIEIKNGQFSSYDTKKVNDQSNRKRIKIFNTKPHSMEDDQHSSIAMRHQNQTFAKYTTHPVNQSSAIMGEESKEEIILNSNNKNAEKQSISFQQNHSNTKERKNMFQNYQSDQPSTTTDVQVQVDSQSIEDASQRLRKQALILKYSKRWFKNTLYSQKCPINRKKAIAVNLWKLSACFDQNIATNAKKQALALQNLWKKQQKFLYESKMFPYNELSLKRKKYTQLMFDLQQKVYHRKKIQSQLKSILINRNRKQRIVFYLYFCRFVKNSFNTQKVYKAIKQRAKLGQTTGGATGVTAAGPANSQIVSVISSHVRNQDHINLPHRKSATSVLSNRSALHSKQISKQPSMQRLDPETRHGKQNKTAEGKKKDHQQQEKLKQLLSEKQRTQRLLASQCVKLQGLIKMSVTLTQATFRTNNYAMKKLIQTEYNAKLNNLASQVNGMEFKFQLMMTKCRLGLANNSNKLSTLENLLDFTHLLK